jgi:glycosyltransferase involved in cell wall biosynthesis
MIGPVVALSVVIPAYNEAHGIGPVLDELTAVLGEAGIEHEIVVVDDGSSDGTSDVIADKAASLPAVRLVSHPHNRGYGASLKTGILAAASDIVAITDADGTYPSSALPALYRQLVDEGADMVVGARTGKNVHIPLVRRPAKAVLRGLANYLSGRRIPDLNSGLRVFRKEIIVERFNLISDGFSFTTTVTLALLARNRDVIFTPIDYMKRTGTSKIRPIADTFNFVVLILRVSVYFEPLKVFLPVAGVLATVGLAWGVQQWMATGGLGEAPVLFLVSALQTLLVGLIADMISRRH